MWILEGGETRAGREAGRANFEFEDGPELSGLSSTFTESEASHFSCHPMKHCLKSPHPKGQGSEAFLIYHNLFLRNNNGMCLS